MQPLGIKLRHWNHYIKTGHKPASPELAGLPAFRARFELASRFESFSVQGMNSGTTGIYARVTRIGLAYSALEYLEKCLTIKGYPEILAPDLIQELKNPELRGLVENAKSGFRSHAVKKELDAVLGSKSKENVRPMVMLFRNSLFHGEFTAGGWNARPNQKTLKLLDSLAQVTLRKADETFTNWFEANC
jgi:hypothetical protein